MKPTSMAGQILVGVLILLIAGVLSWLAITADQVRTTVLLLPAWQTNVQDTIYAVGQRNEKTVKEVWELDKRVTAVEFKVGTQLPLTK